MSASARSPHCASHRFVAAKAVVAFFRAAPAIEFERFVTDLDSVVSQDRPLVPEQPRHQRGLVDTSANIDLEKLDPTQLPTEVAVDTLTTAELAAGPHARANPEERGRRQDRLQRAEAAFDPLPFDSDAARAYGRIFSALMISGRKDGAARAVDLLIAATALAAGLPLYTRNGDDFLPLADLVEVVV